MTDVAEHTSNSSSKGKKPKSRKSQVAILISIAISAVILVALFSRLDWVEFLHKFRGLHYQYALVVLALMLLSYWIRAIRWRYLIPSQQKLSLTKLFEAAVVGFMATSILPLRAGEFIRPWVLSRWQPVTFATGFASIVTERVFDVVAMLFLLGLCLLRIELPDTAVAIQGIGEINVRATVDVGAKALAMIAGVIIVIMFFSYFWPKKMSAFSHWLFSKTVGKKNPALAEKLEHMGNDFIDGLKALSSVTDLLLVLFWSLVLWLEMAVIFLAGLWMFGEFPSLWVGIMVTLMVALAVAAPSAPGFLGTFQLGCVAALSLIYSFEEEFAMAFSLVIHILQYVLLLSAGAIILSLEGLGFKELRKRSAK